MSHLPEMIILCGGKGQRLSSLTTHAPKPLLSIAGSPFLLRLILQWKSEGVGRFILATHYLADHFRKFAEENRHIGEVEVVEEPEPLGTGGGLKYAVQSAAKTNDFLVANGDSYVSQSLSDLRRDHYDQASPFTLTAVRALNVLGGAHQKGCLVINNQNEITGFSTQENIQDGWINGGLYSISKEEILRWPQGKYDLEKQILPDTANHRVRVLKSEGNLLDIGIPACYSLFDKELGPLEALFTKVEKLKSKLE